MKSIILGSILTAGTLFPVLPVNAQRIGDPYPTAREALNDGVEYYNNDKYNDAIEKLLLVNENDSFYFNATYQLALSYQALKQLDKARQKALEGVLNKNNFHRDFMVLYASVLEDMGQKDSAIKVLDEGIRKDPYYTRFLYEKAFLYGKRKDWDNAIRYYTEAMKLNVMYPFPHFRMGYIAANARKPALALMAFNTLCMVSNNEELVSKAIAAMQQIASNNFDPDTFAIDEKHLSFAKDLEDVDLVIHSKAALSKKYKGLVKLNYNILKQMQVLCEKLPDNYQSDNWLMNFYVNLHKKIWNEKKYVGSALHNLRFADESDIQSQIKSKIKEVQAFQVWARDYLDAYRNKATVTEDGKTREIRLWWHENRMGAIGEENDKGENIGHWVFFSEYGYKVAEGDYNNGKKTGKWTYYYDSGELKSEEEYKDGINNGAVTRYYINGSLKESSSFENNKQRGLVSIYNANNTVSITATIDASDKISGTRYDYDSYGRLEMERAYKNSQNDGVYRTFHPNGQVNVETNSVQDNVHGPITYHYDNGQVRTTGQFNKGNRHGEWKSFHKNGKDMSVGSYSNGKETGVWKYYYDDGTLEKEENYENGTKKGSYKYYDREGKVYAEIFVKGGKIDAYKFTDKDGKVFAEAKSSGGKLHYFFYNAQRNRIIEGDLVNGNEEGTWKYYYENGALEYEIPYEKGKKEGVMTYYFRNGKKKYQQMYEDGQLQGFYKSYFTNGNTECEGYYCDDERCGTWTYYYVNGKLNTREFYRNGVITGKDYDYATNGTMLGYANYELGYLENYYLTDSLGNVYHKTGLKFGTGIYQLKTPEGMVYHNGRYKAGKRDSLQTYYYGPGKVQSTEWFNMGKEYGVYKYYFDNGKVQQTGISTNGEQDSTWNYFNEKGERTKTVVFKDGRYHGKYVSYYSATGKPEVECEYVNGNLNGRYKVYSYEGILIFDGLYEEGVLKSYTYLGKDGKPVPEITLKGETGDIVTYFPNGNIALKYRLENGWLQGAYLENYENGKPQLEAFYRDNDNEGSYKLYYPNGNLRKVSNYYADELDGVQTEYHENGKISRETTYVLGSRTGVCKTYDTTGKLTGKTVYRYNKIVN